MVIKNVLAVAALLACATPLLAQQGRKLEISFNEGLVTLVAENVTLREILAEWARKGGSRIANGDKVTGAAVLPMEFHNQPEATVLLSMLRDLPGYATSMRIAPSASASVVEAVFIQATRSVTSGSSAGAPQPTGSPVFENPRPQATSRIIQGSPDDEIPPVPPLVGDRPPTTPNAPPPASNPNLRVSPGGVVTSTIPGVIIPVQPSTTTPGAKPPTTGRGGGGGGGGGGGR